MLSACGASSVDTIENKTVERDSITPNSKPKSLFYWTHDTIIQANEPLVKLMDTLNSSTINRNVFCALSAYISKELVFSQ